MKGSTYLIAVLWVPPSNFKKVSFNFLLSDDLAFCGVAPRNAPKSESDVQRFREHSVRERNILKYKMLNNLKLIFDISLKTGEVPREWKEANVTPLFKKGCKLERSNYRPVSLTSTICKILESIIRDKIMKYMQLKK